MRVLGIVDGHNATLCLLENGRVAFAQSEERLSRLKNSSGFPSLTLGYIHERIAPPETIDLAVLYGTSAYGYRHFVDASEPSSTSGGHYWSQRSASDWRRRIIETTLGWKLRRARWDALDRSASLRARIRAKFAELLHMPEERFVAVDHHLSHVYSAIPNIQEWPRALVFTLDGAGDGLCATVSLCEGGRVTRLDSTDEWHSIGAYYWATTLVLGMKGLEHEGKVMGLAPYGRPSAYAPLLRELERRITVTDAGEWKSVHNPDRLPYDLEELFRFQRFDNIAGAVQELTERLVLRWIEGWVRRTGCADVAVAGGVFLNVKLSQRILDAPWMGRFFVVPSAGDESCAIGAAVWGSMTRRPDIAIEPLQGLYLGAEFTDEEVAAEIERSGASARYRVHQPAGIADYVGQLLADNHIVARCCGRMEFGARALGNRSILANPRDPRNVARINQAIKSRDFWMPFAPSILEEEMARYVVHSGRYFAPYMSITFDSTPTARQDLAAAIHPRDFTMRPQAVRREWNPEYHAIISAFAARTGIQGVLNTSFNLHGEPLVCSPRDAIHTLDNSDLDTLVLGSYVLEKIRKG
jgi:carbamoyltransferase